MNDISIDLETLSQRFDAAIIAIGAVRFDRNTGKLGSTFYQEVALDSAIKAGHVSGATLSWWTQQSAETRKIFLDNDKKLDLASALVAFATWVRSALPGVRVWSNQAAFDIAALEHAYAVGCVGLAVPWHGTCVRDIYTIIEATSLNMSSVLRVDTHHNVLDGAIHQANLISAALHKIKGTGPAPRIDPVKEKKARAIRVKAGLESEKPDPLPAINDDDDEL